jgi:excisionase family DNA binding protein
MESPVQTYLTAREVAARLRISATTIYELCRAGELEFCRFGAGKSHKRIRIIAASVDAYERRAKELPVESPKPDRRRPMIKEQGFDVLRRFGFTPPQAINAR